MAKIVRSDKQVWVWVKPAASIIYQGVEWDATKIHHKSTSVAIACLAAASGGSAAIPKSELESNRGDGHSSRGAIWDGSRAILQVLCSYSR